MPSLTPVRASDPTFVGRLRAHHLPVEDLEADGAACFAVVEDDAVVGYGGLVERGPDALLRSVVVADAPGHGAGRLTVEAICRQARANGVERVWLLTTDAQAFFAALGWTAVERAHAPKALLETTQFQSTCPASATLMVRCVRA